MAIYLCLLTVFWGVAAALAHKLSLRAGGGFLFLAFLVLTVQTDSRNAVFAIGISFFALALALLILRQKNRGFLVLGVLGVSLLMGAYFKPYVIKKQVHEQARSGHLIDLERLMLWSSAIKVGQERLLFGYGVGNFREANSPANLRRIAEESGHSYRDDQHHFTDHAHNLTLNWLVERGGVAIAIFYFWFTYLIKVSWKALQNARSFLFWPISTMLIVVASYLCGLGNTSWHHEHGLLAALFIGLGVSNSLRSLALSNQSRV